MRSEKEIREKLKELQDFCIKEDYTLEEMQGLKFCLNELDNIQPSIYVLKYNADKLKKGVVFTLLHDAQLIVLFML